MAHPPRQGLRAAAWALLGLGIVGLVVEAGFPLWACNPGTWKCPATGCGDAPQAYCRGAVTTGALVLVVAIALLAALAILLFLSRSRGWHGPVPPPTRGE